MSKPAVPVASLGGTITMTAGGWTGPGTCSVNALLTTGRDLDSIRREFVRRGRDSGRMTIDEAR
jgi:hypothetical protein